MNKKIVLLTSLGLISTSIFGFTLAAWTVDDRAGSFGVKVSIEPPTPKQEGYYLSWNGGDPFYFGSKDDEQHSTVVSATTAGNQTFVVTDENGEELDGASGTIKLDILGEYTFCYRAGEAYTHGPSEHTYMYYSLYYSDNLSWGESNIKAYLFNNTTNNGWPGNGDYTVSWAKTDGYGKEVYKITPNAALYAQEGSKLVINNNSGTQSVDIDLCSTLADSLSTGIYFDDSDTKVNITLNTSAVSWWAPNANMYAWLFGGSKTDKWQALTKVNNTTYTIPQFDRTEYAQVIFCRMNTSAGSPDWSKVHNQTVDCVVPSCAGATLSLLDEKEGDNQKTSWGTYLHNISTYTFSK